MYLELKFRQGFDDKDLKATMSTSGNILSTPQFEKFLNEARILIVDSNFTYRVALKHSLIFFGANTERLRTAKNLAAAKAIIIDFQPQIIISDFLLDDGIGTHLMTEQKGNCIFILVSSVVSQAAVANAAEMEIDQFIFKPYSQLQLRDVLKDAVYRVKYRTKSDQFIEDGKELLSIGEVEKAAILFENAKKDPLAFARACSYLGEIKQIKNELQGASKAFRDGLRASETNFRCLIGLFNSLLNDGRMDEGYALLKKIMIHYPECPERLMQGLNLAVRTNNFVDIEEMYSLFELMYQKPETLLKYMSSALLVTGHYHLKHKNAPAAMECFKKGIEVKKGSPKLGRYVQEKLAQYGIGSVKSG